MVASWAIIRRNLQVASIALPNQPGCFAEAGFGLPFLWKSAVCGADDGHWAGDGLESVKKSNQVAACAAAGQPPPMLAHRNLTG
jgi:hypothetical protein